MLKFAIVEIVLLVLNRLRESVTVVLKVRKFDAIKAIGLVRKFAGNFTSAAIINARKFAIWEIVEIVL